MSSLKLAVKQKVADDMLRRLGLSLSASFWRQTGCAMRRLCTKRSARGRPRHHWRLVISAVLYRLRTGCQWRALPTIFGSPSTLHGWFQVINRSGMWGKLWRTAVGEVYKRKTAKSAPLLLDASLVKAPLGGESTGPSPVHRGRLGSKRSLLTTATGLPLAVILAPANRHDSKLVEQTFSASTIALRGAVVVCDLGYRGKAVASAARKWGVTLSLPSEQVQRTQDPLQRGRWCVERSFAWLNNWRGLATRYERKHINHLGMLHLWAWLRWHRVDMKPE